MPKAKQTQITLNKKWRELAACKGADTSIFFTERGQSTEPAKTYCRACPVQRECLHDAMTNYSPGIWGNTSERQRKGRKVQYLNNMVA